MRLNKNNYVKMLFASIAPVSMPERSLGESWKHGRNAWFPCWNVTNEEDPVQFDFV